MYQSAPRNPTVDPAIVIDGEEIRLVERFCQLGATLLSDAIINVDVHTRTVNASNLGKLERRLWWSHDKILHVKISVYKAMVRTVLLYGTETWNYYRRHIKTLDAFHLRCLRHICGATWQQKISNMEILDRCPAGTPPNSHRISPPPSSTHLHIYTSIQQLRLVNIL